VYKPRGKTIKDGDEHDDKIKKNLHGDWNI
jgi:hypothetical protein